MKNKRAELCNKKEQSVNKTYSDKITQVILDKIYRYPEFY